MDCESDESERWEDFFGSSTDISPTVIAYYDRLNSSIDDTFSLNSLNNSKPAILIDTKSSRDSNSLLDYQPSSIVNVSSQCESIALPNEESSVVVKPKRAAPPPLPKLPPSIHRRNRNFRALSANVQRLISHSNTSLHPDDMNENHSLESLNDAIFMPSAKHERKMTLSSTSTSSGSRFKHPLSKNTCKLTQSGGNDLVIDDSDGGYVTPPETYAIVKNGIYDSEEHQDRSDGDNNNDDEEKTPTNEYPPTTIDFNQQQPDDVKSMEISPPTEDSYNNNDQHDEDAEEHIYEECIPPSKMEYTPCQNEIDNAFPRNVKSFIHSMISRNDDSVAGPVKNEVQKSPTPSISSTQSETKSPKSQLFAIRAQSIEKSTKNLSISSSTSCSSGDTAAADESIVGNEDEKSSSNLESQKDSATVPDESTNLHSENDQSKIDLKRVKVRPLSSVSISSTSSSSSSVSDDHSSNQNAISYLASVESLADHSENELVALGNNLTVTERSCLEIVDSERSYVEDLGQVIRGYLNDWKERGCLRDDELTTLFGNIEEVYDFNVILLSELEQSGMDPNRIAKCFIKLHDKFDAYTHYCTSYPDAISLLTTLLQASQTNALLTSTQKSLQHTLPLGSYLLKPVQRILKYHLLLDNLRKHCDVAEVAQAHEIMKSVARHIDQVKRSLEQQSRVRELSGILDGWLGPELTVLGDLIHEGTLMESSKPRTVLLFETMLIITKKKEDNRLQFKTYIHCKNLMLIEHFPGEPASFSVIPYNDVHPNQIKLTARNRDQKRQWAQHIKQVMLMHFDIPNRAKELLFKLGEEEDRTPDKNTWKWNNNSSTTPEYLERRNQYRRSEMRYRSKKQRKIFNTSLSMVEDNLSELSLPIKDNGKTKPTALDSMIKELQERNSLIKQSDNDSISQCSIGDGDSKTDEVQKNGTQSGGDMLTEDELPFDANKALPSKPASALDKAKSKLLEVRMYNTKTLPKRIANLKKQRSKTLKETSTFYMDLPEENNATDTVLKITESSDDIAVDDVRVNRRRASLDATDTLSKANEVDGPSRKLSSVSLLSPISFNERMKNDKNKRDIDIISELLKDHKEFDRILKKPPKKLNDTDKTSSSHDARSSKFPKSDSFLSAFNANTLRLPLPPIPVEANDAPDDDKYIHKPLPPEPIYESLLRNVHVPYKFPSPILSRSMSQPNARFMKVKRPTEAPPKRPDSDYVMLSYSENGELTSIDDEVHLPKHSNFRKSDTNINYHMRRSFDEITPPNEPISLNFASIKDALRGSTSSEINYSMRTTTSNDLLSAHSQSIETVQQSNDLDSKTNDDLHETNDQSNFSKITTSKLPERRVSDVTGMHRKIIHKQGSRTLGSRIASVDYVDPSTLFQTQQNANNYQAMVAKVTSNYSHVQRDSVLTLTSSNDSMNTYTSNHDVQRKSQNGTKLPTIVVTNSTTNSRDISPVHSSNSSCSSGDDSYYEKTVETCLENDGIFRDSAIYSDDNNEKPYVRAEHIYSTIEEAKQFDKEKPVPPPKLNTKRRQSIVARTAPPPPLPAKPAFIKNSSPSFKINKPVEKFVAPPTVESVTIDNTKVELIPTNGKSLEIPISIAPDLVCDINEPKMMDSLLIDGVIPPKISDETDNPLQSQFNARPTEFQSSTPPAVPVRNNSKSSWVLKQIQNFDK